MQVRDGAMIEMVHGLRHACIHACRKGGMDEDVYAEW